MNEIKINISGVEYNIKQSFRSLMLFENLTGKNINDANNSVNDLMLMFYCVLKGCNKDFEFDFESFVDLIDSNPESVEVFTDYLQKQAKPVDNKKKQVLKKH